MKRLMLTGMIILGIIIGLNPVVANKSEDPYLWLE